MDTCSQIFFSKTADKDKYLELKKQIQQSNFKGKEKLLLNADMTYYSTKEDWVNYAKTAVPLMDKYYLNNEGMLNNISYTFYEKVSDKKMLAKAMEWAKKCTELSPDSPANFDTYACVLFKSGNKKEAIKTEEKVIELLKKTPDAGFPVEEAEKTLARFKK